MEIGGSSTKLSSKICNKSSKGSNSLNCVVVCAPNSLSNALMWGISDIECLSCIKSLAFTFP